MKPPLSDSFGRSIDYIRLSVTDRCDLRCFYCMPEGYKDFETPAHWLTFDEVERVVAAFGRLGVHRVRITGGEPLVRKGVAELAARLNRLPGIDDLSLSTNAVQLARYARPLFQGGVRRLNVSLDTLNAKRFAEITGGGKLHKVLDGLMAAKAEGFHPIKINMVAMKGVNDDEFEAMLEFCIEHDFTLRFIETMPMGATGKAALGQFISLQEVKEGLMQRYQLVPAMMEGGGPARYMRPLHGETRIGFITPLSQHFCETCNRVRLSVDGTLYMCLGQEHQYPLRELLRQGICEDELAQHIQRAINLKPERHEFNEKPEQSIRFMSMTGG